MGYSTFLLEASLYSVGRVLQSIPLTTPEDIVVESRVYRVHFDSKTGAMKQITNKLSGFSGITESFSQTFLQYKSSIGNNVSGQASGFCSLSEPIILTVTFYLAAHVF